MHVSKICWLLSFAFLTPLIFGQAPSPATTHDPASVPSPQIFAPGVVSGPANHGSPTFSPDGNTIFFSRSTSNWSMIVESHLVQGHWSRPTLAPFSGEWSESSPEMSPDGSYIVFQSTRPTTPASSTDHPKEIHRISNLWRVDRVGSGWTNPTRLPDTVNIGHAIWKPSVAADGTIYFVSIDEKRNKRLYSARYVNGSYQQAQPLPFSDGTTSDVDPEIAPDGSFLVFCSSGRLPDDQKDHLFIVLRKSDEWGPVVPIHYAGDEKDGYSTDDEPHLGLDHRTLYFTSDRALRANFPRTPDQAQQDFNRLESWGWFSGYANVWSIPLSPWLQSEHGGESGATN
jgi:hypothetical protein